MLLALPTKEGGNKGSESKKGAIKFGEENKITAPILMCGVNSYIVDKMSKRKKKRERDIVSWVKMFTSYLSLLVGKHELFDII